MLLVIEVGNTNTGVGVFDGRRLLVSWRLTSRREQTADEYGVFIQTLLGTRGIEAQHITGVAISNVVCPVGIAQQAAAAAERVFEFLDEPEETPERNLASASAVTGAVAFEHIAFGYDAVERIAKIRPGQIIISKGRLDLVDALRAS